MTETNKKRNMLQLTKESAFMSQVNEINDIRGYKNIAKTIRYAVDRYYHTEFRKETYGYQAGVESFGSNKVSKPVGPKISTREQTVFALNNMTNDEVTAWLVSSGFQTKKEIEMYEWVCITSPITAEREILAKQKNLPPDQRYEFTVFDWPTFINEVRKWYKDKAKGEKIASQ